MELMRYVFCNTQALMKSSLATSRGFANKNENEKVEVQAATGQRYGAETHEKGKEWETMGC